MRIEKEAGLLENVNGMIWTAFALVSNFVLPHILIFNSNPNCKAMESIPLTLAHNAGMDSLSIMAQLKAEHSSSNVCSLVVL